jgi:hypothetical protein
MNFCFQPLHGISGLQHWGTFVQWSRCLLWPLSGPGTVGVVGGKLRLVRFLFIIFRHDLCISKTSRITTPLFSCHCCLISNAKSPYLRCFPVTVTCRLWFNGISISMNTLVLFFSSELCLADWKELAYPLILVEIVIVFFRMACS